MNNIVEGFKKLLDDENKDENDVQRYLEDNSELIPLPFLAGHQLHESAILESCFNRN